MAREIGVLDPDRQVDLIAAATLGRPLQSDDADPAGSHEPAVGPGAQDLLRSTIELGTTLHQAVGDRPEQGPSRSMPASKLANRIVLVGLYSSVSERKKALREVTAQTIDLAAGPTRPVPTGSDS